MTTLNVTRQAPGGDPRLAGPGDRTAGSPTASSTSTLPPVDRKDSDHAKPHPGDLSDLPATPDVLNALLVAGTSNPHEGKHLTGAFHGMADIQAARRTRAPSATPEVPQPRTPSNDPFEPHRAGVGAFYLSHVPSDVPADIASVIAAKSQGTMAGDVAQTGLSPSVGGTAGDFHNVDLLV